MEGFNFRFFGISVFKNLVPVLLFTPLEVPNHLQTQLRKIVWWKRGLKFITKLGGKILQLATLLKDRLRHMCFLANFLILFRMKFWKTSLDFECFWTCFVSLLKHNPITSESCCSCSLLDNYKLQMHMK